MNHRTRILAALLLACTGCAYMAVRPIAADDRTSWGYRFYDARPAVLAGCTQTQIIYLPDRSRGYVAQPRAWFAKNDYELNIENGMLTKTKGSLDATAALSFLQSATSEAIKAAGSLAALSGQANATPPEAVLYLIEFDSDGAMSGLRSIGSLGLCPVFPTARSADGSGDARGQKASGGKEEPGGGS